MSIKYNGTSKFICFKTNSVRNEDKIARVEINSIEFYKKINASSILLNLKSGSTMELLAGSEEVADTYLEALDSILGVDFL